MFKSIGSSLIWRGVLALAVGVAALAWPGVTVLALVFLFAVYAFMAAGLELATASSSDTAKPVAAHLLLAGLDVAAAVGALAWPGVTALVLVLLVASWAVVTGGIEIYAGVRTGQLAGTRALFILTGLASIAFGVVLFARPGVGALTLALLFGLFNLIAGASMLVQGIDMRATDKSLRELVEPSPTHAAA